MLEIFILGIFFKKVFDDDEFKVLEFILGYVFCFFEVIVFNRFEFKLFYIYGISYKRMFRRNCLIIKY